MEKKVRTLVVDESVINDIFEKTLLREELAEINMGRIIQIEKHLEELGKVERTKTVENKMSMLKEQYDHTREDWMHYRTEYLKNYWDFIIPFGLCNDYTAFKKQKGGK